MMAAKTQQRESVTWTSVLGLVVLGLRCLPPAAAADWEARGCKAALKVAAEVKTAGCAGFEAFAIDDETMIAGWQNISFPVYVSVKLHVDQPATRHFETLVCWPAANFWDGRSADMSAQSVLYGLSEKSKRNGGKVRA